MSYTDTYTNAYTESRAKEVTDKVYEDLLTIMSTGLVNKERIDNIRTDLLYFQKKKVLDSFQFQFKNSSGKIIKALHYKVIPGGRIYRSDESGGIDYYDIVGAARMTFFVGKFFQDSPHLQEVEEYTKSWGEGSEFQGSSSEERVYSKDNYGIKRNLRE